MKMKMKNNNINNNTINYNNNNLQFKVSNPKTYKRIISTIQTTRVIRKRTIQEQGSKNTKSVQKRNRTVE